MGLTYTDPGDPQRFWGPLTKCFTVEDLNAMPPGTNLRGSSLERDGWGTPYTANGHGQFWDWGNDYTVGAEDIATLADALPGHPFTPLTHPSQSIHWVDAQDPREREAAAEALEEFPDTLDAAGVPAFGDQARTAAAEHRR